MTITDANILLVKIREQSWFEPNDWEDGFLDSIQDLINRETPLSPKQSDKLQDIYRKAYA